MPAASLAVTPSFVVTVDTPALSLISDFVGANVCVLPAASAIVVEPPVTVVVLPAASVYVADVKPVKAFANLRFNVPVVASPNTAMLPSVRSAAVVDAPPLMLSCSPCLRLTTVVSSPPNSCVASPVALLMASSICFLLTADVFVVPAATFLISVLPASIPVPSTLTVFVPSVAVIPFGVTVVVFVPSVVDKPPFVSAVVLPAASLAVTPSFVVTVDTPALSLISDFVGANVCVLPAASAIVVDPPVTVVVLPAASVYVADVKPVKTFANLTFNVPAPSDTTPILPVVKSAGVVTPPLMDNTSPCLRTEVVPVSPSNLCSASANACALLVFAFVTASLIAFATFCVVATPSLPVVVPCVDPAAPMLPVASSRTSLPSSTLTVYVFTPPAVASDTVAKPVPATLTASWAALTATAFTAFSDTATS